MKISIRPIYAALGAFYLLLLILVGFVIVRRVHTPVPQQNSASQNDRFIFDNAGMLTHEQELRLEQQSQHLYRQEKVRVFVVTAGIQTNEEAARAQDKAVNLTISGSLIDRNAGLYSPAVVVYVHRAPDGKPMIGKGWTGNFWYAHWDQLEPVQQQIPLSDSVAHIATNVTVRARTQTEAYSWRHHFVSYGFIFASIFIFLAATLYWFQGFVLRIWDGRKKPAWVLPVECMVANIAILSSFKGFQYLAGWPEMDLWFYHLCIFTIVLPLTLLLPGITKRLPTFELSILTGFLAVVAVLSHTFGGGADYSEAAHWAAGFLRDFSLILGTFCVFLISARLWLNYMGDQSRGFVGDFAGKIQSFDHYYIHAGKPSAAREMEPSSIAFRRLITESSIANVYWLWLSATGMSFAIMYHRTSPRASATRILHRAEFYHSFRHPLARYHYLPQARSFLSKGELKKARAACLHAMELLRSLTSHWPNVAKSTDFLACQETLGEIVQLQGNPEEARELLFQAWSVVEQELTVGDISPQGIRTRMRLGRYFYALGDRVRAEGFFNEALQCLDLLRTEFIVNNSLLSLRDISRKLRAEHLSAMADGIGSPISAAVEIRPFLHHLPAYQAEAAYSMALCLEPEHKTSQSSPSLEQQERVAQLRKRALLPGGSSISPLSLLHNILSKNARSEQAGQDLYQDPVQDRLWETAPANLTDEWDQQRYQGQSSFGQSYELEAYVAAWLGRNEGVRLRSEDEALSKATLLFALEQYRILGKADGLANIYLGLAEYGMNVGQRVSAAKLGQMALAIAEKIGHIDLQRQAHLLLAKTYRQAGLLTEARAQADQAINLIEEVRQRVPNPDVRALFTSSRIDAYAEQVIILLSLGQPAQALEYVERSKSRALVELLGNHKIRVRDVTDEVLIRQDEELQKELVGLNYQLRSHEGTVGEDVDVEDAGNERRRRQESSRLADRDKQAALRRKLAVVKQQMRDNVRDWTTLKVVQMLPFDDASQPDDIRRQLQRQFSGSGERVVALEYYVMNDRTLIFVVPCWKGEEPLFVVEADLSRAELDKLTHGDFQDTTLNAPKDADGWPEPLFLETLYTHLFAQVAPQIQQMAATMLLFVPHAGLHALPLHAVYHRDERGERRYLIEDYPCAYVPSLSVLGHLKQPQAYTHKDSALVMGNPLPVGEAIGKDSTYGSDIVNSEFEAEDVAALLGTEPIVGRRATEAFLLAEAEKHQIIHLACHAEFDPQDALQSHLVMADGLLQVDEVLDLNLKASLVTLSACRSGVSAVSDGDELVGMTRAWLYAGSPSVVASQWNVSDEASWRLMVSFYRHWTKEGQSKARALQSAQLKVLKQRRGPRGKEGDFGAWDPACSPAIWAPFILVGNPL